MTLATSASHKAIGRQYLWSGLLFLLLWMIGPVLLRSLDPPMEFNDDPRETYNFFMTTHGTMLVFFGIVPLLFSGFGNYVIPVAHGSKMCFPRINFTGLILFYLGSGFLVISLIARSQSALALAIMLNISSSLICSVNFAATILRLHRSGMNWNKMSFMVLTVLATAILLFINFVPLGVASIIRHYGLLNF